VQLRQEVSEVNFQTQFVHVAFWSKQALTQVHGSITLVIVTVLVTPVISKQEQNNYNETFNPNNFTTCFADHEPG